MTVTLVMPSSLSGYHEKLWTFDIRVPDRRTGCERLRYSMICTANVFPSSIQDGWRVHGVHNQTDQLVIRTHPYDLEYAAHQIMWPLMCWYAPMPRALPSQGLDLSQPHADVARKALDWAYCCNYGPSANFQHFLVNKTCVSQW